MLTLNQIQELLNIIEKNNILFINRHLGPDYLNDSEIAKLKSVGIDPKKYYKTSKDISKLSFHFGLISDSIGNKEAKLSTFQDLKKYFEEGKFLPLTKKEKFTLDSIKKQYLGDIKANKNRIFNDINNIISNNQKNNREAYEKVIRDEIYEGTLNKKSREEIAREIAHKTGDWNRNFKRIVYFISHSAFDEGRALAFEKEYGEDVLVWKQIFNGACKICVKLYTELGSTSKPKIFKLSDLKKNGTNIGKKQSDWNPIIGATHPHCRCVLREYNSRFNWNDKTKDFDIPNKNKDSRKKIDRPKVKITFRNKEYKV